MKTKKDFFNEFKESYLKKIAELEIDIEIYSSFPPNEVVGTKRLSPDSTEDISAEQMIEIKSKELSNWTTKLNAVNSLLKK